MKDIYEKIDSDYSDSEDYEKSYSQEEAWIYGTLASFQEILRVYGAEFVISRLNESTEDALEKFFIEQGEF